MQERYRFCLYMPSLLLYMWSMCVWLEVSGAASSFAFSQLVCNDVPCCLRLQSAAVFGCKGVYAIVFAAVPCECTLLAAS